MLYLKNYYVHNLKDLSFHRIASMYIGLFSTVYNYRTSEVNKIVFAIIVELLRLIKFYLLSMIKSFSYQYTLYIFISFLQLTLSNNGQALYCLRCHILFYKTNYTQIFMPSFYACFKESVSLCTYMFEKLFYKFACSSIFINVRTRTRLKSSLFFICIIDYFVQ